MSTKREQLRTIAADNGWERDRRTSVPVSFAGADRFTRADRFVILTYGRTGAVADVRTGPTTERAIRDGEWYDGPRRFDYARDQFTRIPGVTA